MTPDPCPPPAPRPDVPSSLPALRRPRARVAWLVVAWLCVALGGMVAATLAAPSPAELCGRP